ncbi:hypothetical protein KDL29_04025 [bacterium]|nr:hypothetical protein [bacterium]UNM08774.1 MAG: hypothetical protein H7A35_01710 [Planctomycetales bacterium]
MPALIVLLAIGSLLVCSCGSTSFENTGGWAGDPPASIHSTSGLVAVSTAGKSSFNRSASAIQSGDALQLNEDAAGSSWGIWKLESGGYGLAGLEIELEVQGGPGVWIGLADYSTGHWEFSGPYVTNASLELEQPKHLSPAGNVFCAVLCPESGPALVHGLALLTSRSGWQVVPLSSGDAVGNHPTLAVVDGTPAISFIDSQNSLTRVSYIRSLSDSGADPSHWAPAISIREQFDEFSDPYIPPTGLVVADGNPAILFAGATSFETSYIRSTSTDGMAKADWQQFALIAPGTSSGGLLAIVDGHPAAVYWDDASQHLVYVRSATASGASPADWNNRIDIASSGTGLFGESLAVIDGRPGIACSAPSGNPSLYLHSATPAGDNQLDWAGQILLAGSADMRNAFLAPVAGRPAITFHDPGTGKLRYVRADDAGGDSALAWPAAVDITATSVPFAVSPLLEVSGKPATAWFDDGSGSLMYARSSGPGGMAAGDWNAPAVVDNAVPEGGHMSMALVAGHPAIAYSVLTSPSTEELRYAILLD